MATLGKKPSDTIGAFLPSLRLVSTDTHVTSLPVPAVVGSAMIGRCFCGIALPVPW